MRRHLPENPEEDISKTIEDYLTSHPGFDDDRYEYGVYAILQGRTVTMKLTFLKDKRYCCADPHCHLDLEEDEGWERLRDILDGEGIEPPRPLTIRCETVVEEGSLFDGSCRDLDDRDTPRTSEGRELDRAVFVEDRV